MQKVTFRGDFHGKSIIILKEIFEKSKNLMTFDIMKELFHLLSVV